MARTATKKAKPKKKAVKKTVKKSVRKTAPKKKAAKAAPKKRAVKKVTRVKKGATKSTGINKTVVKRTLKKVTKAEPAAEAASEEQEPKKAPVRSGKKRQVLLCPGPVNLSQHVRNALVSPDICHREPEFSKLLQNTRAKLLHALDLSDRWVPVIINGSGTAALESAVMSAVDPGKKMLVLNNGVYGSRIARLARTYGIQVVEFRAPLREGFDLKRVETIMKRESKVSTVAMVHHETSTGLLNPVKEVGALVKKYKKRFLVDAISSLGSDALDIAKSNIGMCVGSSGKSLHGAPGLSFVLLSRDEAERVQKLRPKAMYLNLGAQLKAQDAGEPPFTPSVQLFMAFDAALDDLLKEGLKNRLKRYAERAKLLRDGFEKLGLQYLVDPALMSNTLTTLQLPKYVEYDLLHKRLKRAGFVIYAGQSELKGKIFRVSHMGQITLGELKEFLSVLGPTIETLSYRE